MIRQRQIERFACPGCEYPDKPHDKTAHNTARSVRKILNNVFSHYPVGHRYRAGDRKTRLFCKRLGSLSK